MSGQQHNAGQAFLKMLWGNDPPGQIQLWSLYDKRSTYWPHWRGVQCDGERDVFCAMGTTARRLGARQRATVQQVCAIAGMWLDLDVKPGSAPLLNPAWDLAQEFVRPTVIVNSGHGIHCYYLFADGPWVFKTVAERGEAASLARRFVALHQQAVEWHVDPVGDLARLMRLPGTGNYKDPEHPRPVYVMSDDGPRHELNNLRHLLRGISDQPAGPADSPSLFDAPVALTGDTSALAAKLDALLANSPEFADAWEHRPAPTRRDLSPSAWDLCVCSLAQGALTDPELVALMHAHRARWGYDLRKLDRAKYLADTIRRARSGAAARAARGGDQPARRAA